MARRIRVAVLLTCMTLSCSDDQSVAEESGTRAAPSAVTATAPDRARYPVFEPAQYGGDR
jgi:hypothetical protein